MNIVFAEVLEIKQGVNSLGEVVVISSEVIPSPNPIIMAQATNMPNLLEISGGEQAIMMFNIKHENLAQVRQALEALLLNSDIKYTFYQGPTPQLILLGPPGKVRPVIDLVRALNEQSVVRNLVSISAVLQEISKENNNEVGINFKNISVTGLGTYESNSRAYNPSLNVVGASGADLSFQDIRSTGKVLAASEIITPNGVKAELKSSDRVPVMNRDAGGFITTDYKDVETSITVTPVIIRYDAKNPLESLVRMDIIMKVGLIARERTMGLVSAPQLSVREVNTSRIIKADNKEYIMAVIVRDEEFKTRSGIPILSQIPIINLFTSSKKNKIVRTTAYLKIKVNLLP